MEDAGLTIVGVTRFSVISNLQAASGSWKLARVAGSYETYVKTILDEERLKSRANLFFRYSLPSLSAGVGARHRYRHVVGYSTLLPNWLHEMFEEAAQRYRWLRLQAVAPDDDFSPAIALELALRDIAPPRIEELPTRIYDLTKGEWVSFDGRPLARLAVFRLDDDDILSPHFFSALDRIVAPGLANYCVSFSAGYTGLFDNETGRFSAFAPVKETNVSMGITRVIVASVEGGPMVPLQTVSIGAHTTVDKRMPVLADGREPMFIMTRHSGNSSVSDMTPAAIEKRFARLFRQEVRIGESVVRLRFVWPEDL